ncbi:unnamed protein product [Oncorhynchus mykiss]|uniref:Uncharacterized protein n=1 Tax=Oncorhynchus mykiss TaxID=8022 RepID=A0A060XGF7_ONCMY|nr:unnamed protein product [Oncorhynchus mykiss]
MPSAALCVDKGSVSCVIYFGEGRSDRKEREVLGEFTDYNKRYSGSPRRVTDYLCDTPLFLQLLARGLGAMGGGGARVPLLSQSGALLSWGHGVPLLCPPGHFILPCTLVSFQTQSQFHSLRGVPFHLAPSANILPE